MAAWREEQSRLEASSKTPISPPRLIREISEVAPKNSIFVCDTGTSTAWTARHLHVKTGDRYTLSGGLASMAYALPGALGAQLAYPDARVFAICGDGAFAMLMGDFITAVKYQLPVIVIVLNNAKLSFITLEQEAKGLPDWGTDLKNPDFATFAEACGGFGQTVRGPEDIKSALKQALNSQKPAVLDVMVDPDELIMPPEISINQALKFGLAKVREAFGA